MTQGANRTLNVSVYILRQMSKQCRNFSQSTDPEDRNAERGCQLMCFLFPDASFPGPLWTWGVILSSSWMNLWQLQWNSGILYFSFCPILVYRSKLYWNMNIVGLGIYSLQVIIWWKLYFLSPQFKWKGFFPRGKSTLTSIPGLLFSKQSNSECQSPRWFAI